MSSPHQWRYRLSQLPRDLISALIPPNSGSLISCLCLEGNPPTSHKFGTTQAFTNKPHFHLSSQEAVSSHLQPKNLDWHQVGGGRSPRCFIPREESSFLSPPEVRPSRSESQGGSAKGFLSTTSRAQSQGGEAGIGKLHKESLTACCKP